MRDAFERIGAVFIDENGGGPAGMSRLTNDMAPITTRSAMLTPIWITELGTDINTVADANGPAIQFGAPQRLRPPNRMMSVNLDAGRDGAIVPDAEPARAIQHNAWPNPGLTPDRHLANDQDVVIA
jgi:hypothetical protein